jgi:2-C-methyl-D-erythritol 4-phosphate cytidylyltransferase
LGILFLQVLLWPGIEHDFTNKYIDADFQAAANRIGHALMKKYAIIVAGGSGTRMGTNVPKQFLSLQGKPVLWYTLNAFLNAYEDLQIILVVGAEHLQTGENIRQSTKAAVRILITTGGATRFHSVKNGLQHIEHPSIVFIHDAVRCLLSTELINRCYEMTLQNGNAIPAISVHDSIRLETGGSYEIIDRDRVKLIQTPQTFFSDVITDGYNQPFQEHFTDDASVVEQRGIKIHLIEGEPKNIKITEPFDMLVAEKHLEKSRLL